MSTDKPIVRVTFEAKDAEKGFEAVRAIIAAEDRYGPTLRREGVTSVRLGVVDESTGDRTMLPLICLSCGYHEVPGEDFEAHDHEAWREVPDHVRQTNERAHFAEALRIMEEVDTTLR